MPPLLTAALMLVPPARTSSVIPLLTVKPLRTSPEPTSKVAPRRSVNPVDAVPPTSSRAPPLLTVVADDPASGVHDFRPPLADPGIAGNPPPPNSTTCEPGEDRGAAGQAKIELRAAGDLRSFIGADGFDDLRAAAQNRASGSAVPPGSTT